MNEFSRLIFYNNNETLLMIAIFNFEIEFLISSKSQFGTEGDKIYTWVKVKISKLKPGKSNSAHDNQIDRLRIAQR